MSSKPILALLLSMGMLLFVAVGTASAHAKVIASNPGIGSTISSVPTMVTVTTAENMKPGAQFSNLFVYGPSGDLISQGNATVSLNNPKQMSVNMKGEGKGVYVVRWVTVSADDGDPDQGAFIFTVGAPAASSQSATAPSQSSTAQAALSTSGTPIWVPIVVGIVALLVGLGAGMGFGRSRAAAATIPPAPSASSHEQEPTKRA